MNPEQAAINKIDSEKRVDQIKKTADLLLPGHDKIAPIIEKIALDPNEFIDLYSEERVRYDEAYVAERKKDFAVIRDKPYTEGLTCGEVKKLAEVLEYHVIRGINMGHWFPHSRAIKTSEYDDIANGVDLVIEFEKMSQIGHIGLGVDISFSHNLRDKFARIKKEIDEFDGKRNRLAKVKYFNSPKTGIRGELSGLPRVVAALDIGALEDLARAKKDTLNGHMTKHAIVLEMEHQLAVFADYAQINNPLCLDQIMRAQNFMRVISNHLESETKMEQSGYIKNRKAQEAIEDGLSLFR